MSNREPFYLKIEKIWDEILIWVDKKRQLTFFLKILGMRGLARLRNEEEVYFFPKKSVDFEIFILRKQHRFWMDALFWEIYRLKIKQ